MSDAEPLLDWLQNWYAQQCDGDWEHEWGVKIGTLDNPGWTVSIDLEGTGLEARDHPRQDIDRAPQDWVSVWVAEKTFHAACGPGNLTEALTLFRTWATTDAP
ncbi:immunity 53 family protein [Streptomyces sp. NPDC059517]|uniref:immunity 53 family protein n=1 Tax=Streptomyces sp. NPDC059517 TaxID=3346855 RepID=UPI0036BB3662